MGGRPGRLELVAIVRQAVSGQCVCSSLSGAAIHQIQRSGMGSGRPSAEVLQQMKLDQEG